MSTGNLVETVTSQSAISSTRPQLDVPLLRYGNPALGDDLRRTDWSERGAGKDGGLDIRGNQCNVASTAQVGTVPLYDYWNTTIGNHFHTTNWSDLGSGRWGVVTAALPLDAASVGKASTTAC
jgi:hypothetical protein